MRLRAARKRPFVVSAQIARVKTDDIAPLAGLQAPGSTRSGGREKTKQPQDHVRIFEKNPERARL
jgi:hypothetical protein